jgi:uncharacterized protein YcbX
VDVSQVQSLHRYPVKSLSGTAHDRLDLDARGVVPDRAWAVRDEDGKLGSGKSTRRFRTMRGLLELSAALEDDVPVVTFPDGRTLQPGPPLDAALSSYVGRPVTLAPEGEVSHFDEGGLHLVTTAALDALERLHGAPVPVPRLRPNVVVRTGPGHDDSVWIGARLHVGEALVEVVRPMTRCVMLNQAQVGLAPDPHLLDTVARHFDLQLGLVARVISPGPVAVGDAVRPA